MGKGKIIGVVFGSFAVIFVLLVVAAAASPAAQEADKFEGLTDDQVRSAKIFFEQCENQAYFSGAGSETLTDTLVEKCKTAQENLIGTYRANNQNATLAQ